MNTTAPDETTFTESNRPRLLRGDPSAVFFLIEIQHASGAIPIICYGNDALTRFCRKLKSSTGENGGEKEDTQISHADMEPYLWVDARRLVCLELECEIRNRLMNLSGFLTMDTHLLVGLINTELRNCCVDLEDLVKTHDVDPAMLLEKLAASGYEYQADQKQFR